MKKITFLLLILSLSAMFASCVSIHSAGVTDFNGKTKGNIVRANASGFGVLALSTPSPNSLERKAMAKLQIKCEGKVDNITSRMQMRNWMLVQYYSVFVTGNCVK